MKRILFIVVLLFLIAGVLFTLSLRIDLRAGMTRQEIEARLKPGRFSRAGSVLVYYDSFGMYTGSRDFLIATQHITIRLGSDRIATNVSTQWTWRTRW